MSTRAQRIQSGRTSRSRKRELRVTAQPMQVSPVDAPQESASRPIWSPALISIHLGRSKRWIVPVLLVLAFLYRILLALRGWPYLDSDQAVIGLMARHIVTQHEFPYFFWGQFYMGTLESYLAAPLFAIFGSSTLALHIVTIALTLAFLAAMYALGNAAYGRAVGLLTLAWLAFGPSFATLRELTAIGGYQEMLLCSALILLGVYARLRQPYTLPRNRKEWTQCLSVYGSIGIAAGIGLWSDPLILPVLLMAFFALLMGRPREILHVGGLTLIAAFFVSAFPFIIFNLTHHFATFGELIRQSRPEGRSSSWPTPQEWWNQMSATLSVAMPVTFGSPHVCVQIGDVYGSYPTAEAIYSRIPNAMCDGANALFSLAIVAIYGVVSWQVLRAFWAGVQRVRQRESPVLDWLMRHRVFSQSLYCWLVKSGLMYGQGKREHAAMPSGHASDSAVSAKLWLRAMLVGVVIFTLWPYASSIDAYRFEFTSARYLLPLYLTAPLIFGVLWHWAGPLTRSFLDARTRTGTQQRPMRVAQNRPRVLAMMAIVALLGVSIISSGVTFAYAGSSANFHYPLTKTDQQLITFLDARHVKGFYGDYWICYRLAFETNELMKCAVRGQNGDSGLELINNRYTPYEQAMSHVAYPAYVLPANTPEDSQFAAEAAAQGLPYKGYVRTTLDGYAIYYFPGL